jgi:hypothetical protein
VAVLSVKEATLNLKGPRPEGPRREKGKIESNGVGRVASTEQTVLMAGMVGLVCNKNEPVDLLAFDLV